MTVLIDEVNTVNTALQDQYDFGIHKAGCGDVAKAEKAGCEVYKGIEAESVAAFIASDEAAFAAQGQEGFVYKVFACCTGNKAVI